MYPEGPAVPCRDSAFITAEDPLASQPTSLSAWCGSKEESDLPWAEIHRGLDVHPETARRWREKGVLPNTQNYAALLQIADSLGLGHLFRD